MFQEAFNKVMIDIGVGVLFYLISISVLCLFRRIEILPINRDNPYQRNVIIEEMKDFTFGWIIIAVLAAVAYILNPAFAAVIIVIAAFGLLYYPLTFFVFLLFSE